ncbi:sensor domain-containing protein [Streptomyces sp. NPDC019208]|uniref:sensor histidine kinase n=1 Tax=Streptomyces sp. NPDC019208 TaxID=3154683 RepID=UPI00340C6782
MTPRNLWQALTGRAYLRTAWPWRGVAYLGTGVLSGAVALVGVLVLVAFSAVLVGLPLLLFSGVALAGTERWRLRIADAEPAADPHRTPPEPGITVWARTRVREQATWRELAYALLHATVLWPLELLALGVGIGAPLAMTAAPLQLAVDGGHEARVAKLWLVTGYPAAFASAAAGLVLLALFLYPLGALAAARAALARAVLAPREAELRTRIGEVTRSRARLVAAFEAERRRIERDLHDGAQQRLVALTMSLGLARLDVPPDGPLAERLALAHDEAGKALTELRELVHGIHPQVLSDCGLAAALADAADRSAVPVVTDVELPRLERPVETAAYFAVGEALANAAKHSGASRVSLTARHTGDLLAVEIHDDGTGGADPERGTGLTGLADRLAVLDGTLAITSPPGGPTVLRLEIPCRTGTHPSA